MASAVTGDTELSFIDETSTCAIGTGAAGVGVEEASVGTREMQSSL